MILLDETKLERRSLAPVLWLLRLLLKWRPRFWPADAAFPSGTNINDPYVYRVPLLMHLGILPRNSRAAGEARW